MNAPNRTVIVAGVAILAIAVSLLILLLGGRLLTHMAHTPAHYLPADSTALYIWTPSVALQKELQDWQEVPLDSEGQDKEVVAFAFVEVNGSYHSVFFREASPQPPARSKRFGEYDVNFSSAEVEDAVNNRKLTLATFRPFKELMVDAGASSLYWNTRAFVLPPAVQPHPLLASVVESSSHAVLHAADGEWSVSVLRSAIADPAGLSASAVLPSSTLHAELGNTAEWWQNLTHILPSQQSLVLEGVMRQTVATHMGPSVSPQHDVLFLLSHTASLDIAPHGSGTSLLARGTVQDADRLQETLSRLHQSYLSSLPTARVVERQLDDTFSSRDIRSDEFTYEQTEEKINGWHVQRTELNGSENVLLSAIQGGRFLLGTNDAQVQAALSSSTEIPWVPTLVSSAPLARGVFTPVNLPPSIRSILSALFSPSTPVLQSNSPIEWLLEQKGNVLRFAVSPVRPLPATP